MALKTDAHWQLIGKKAHHGIALPLSALRSQTSCGIGEFYDLLPLIDWCKKISFDCLQLLPLTDIGRDTSPYNSMSSCALDPMYLSIAALPGADAKALVSSFRDLTHLPRVALQEVKQKKLEWLYTYFLQTFPQVETTEDYQRFLTEQGWLLPYALFQMCKSQYGGLSWQNWPASARQYNPSLIHASKQMVDFHAYLQYLSYQQLRSVRDYATSNGIFLKGDLPILLSPDSVDVWANPSLFDLTLVAGAPPDYYNKQGQKWGFPLPRWEAMHKNDFSWWKQRLDAAAEGFHLYRIDHVVGFFRIWGIPPNKPAIEGHFVPKNPHLWPSHGEEILEKIVKSSPLLPIAEDLGVIPKEVPQILKKLGICGTKVLRWQRDWELDERYIPYHLYDPLSMTTVSTHDCDTLRGWWQFYPEEAKAFCAFKKWNYQPDLPSERILEILHDAHHTPSYFHINLLQEYLALIPHFVHMNPKEERINIPGELLSTNWTYRFIPFVEEITGHEQLTAHMSSFAK